MRKFKRYLATALVVAMAGTSLPMTALAEETTLVTGWQLQDDGWHFYNSKGKERKNEHRIVNKLWYAFDENGVMYEDELFVGPKTTPELDSKGNAVPNRYAYPNGKLAGVGWLLLNEDGTLHAHDGNCQDTDCEGTRWYYLKAADTAELDPEDVANASYELGEIVAGKEKTIHGKVYGFKNNGAMYSQDWVQGVWDGDKWIPGKTDSADATWHYYLYEGERATNRWVYVYYEDMWCYFNEKGDWDESRTPEAADELAMVDSIAFLGKTNQDGEVEATPGETLTLKFKATLTSTIDDEIVATDSNATVATSSNASEAKFNKKDHNIWMPKSRYGTYKLDSVSEDGTCTVSYTTNPVELQEEIWLVIDGVKSDIVTIAPKSLETATDNKEAADTLLNAVDKEDFTKTDLKDSLESLYTDAENASNADAIKETLLENPANYNSLAEGYAAENKITEAEPDITNEAKDLLPAGENPVEVVGASLNAGEGDTVQLKIAAGDAGELADQDKYETTVAFDITYEVNGEPMTEQLTLPILITISLPQQLAGSDVQLWHIHGDAAPERLTAVTFNEEKTKITFAADKFSDYVLVKEKEETPDPDPTPTPDPDPTPTPDPDPDPTPNPDPTPTPDPTPSTPGSGSSSSGSSSTRRGHSVTTTSTKSNGEWILDNVGWWYRNADGTYPYGTWCQLEYKGKLDWYHFNQQGYIDLGWFTDQDGRIYYLNPVTNDNGFQGAMLTGWQTIDDTWYYFNPISNGYLGAMFVNTTTLDGYQVDENGKFIQ